MSIVIAGAGPVGLMLALRLKQKLGTHEVTLCGPLNKGQNRAYAIAPSTQAILAETGLWKTLQDQAQPIQRMAIGDSALEEPVRPVFLNLAGEEGPLAHILDGQVLQNALQQACQEAGVLCEPQKVTGFQTEAAYIDAELEQGHIQASLLVAAEGSASVLREHADIGWVSLDYEQDAITGILHHAKPHEGTASQHFLEGGPFALLPLLDPHHSAFVWSENREAADVLKAADAQAFLNALRQRAGPERGSLTLEQGPFFVPLSLGLARSWVKPRFALAGDAAHKVHPLAGQGLNLGLQDAESLASHIKDAVFLGLEPSHFEALKNYERSRRPQALKMASLTTSLNTLFSRESQALRMIRQSGLSLVERAETLKTFFIEQAA